MTAGPASIRDTLFQRALLVSLCLHGLTLAWLPGPGRLPPPLPPLQVALPPPEPATWHLAETTPTPPRQPEIPEPAAAPRRPAAIDRRPAAEPSPPPAAPAAATATADFERLVAEAPTAAGTAVALAPVAALAPAPTPAADPAALAEYAQAISTRIGHRRHYPPLAQLRGWEGTATLRLRLAADGRLKEATLAASSGHGVLDRQALAMAQALEQPPPPPATLAGAEFTVLVPVVFRLEN